MIKLFDDHSIVLDRRLETLLGLNEDIVLQQVHYWLELNRKNKRNFHEGRYWNYNTIKKWQEEFPLYEASRELLTPKSITNFSVLIFKIYIKAKLS